jgi:hypothetical protein
LYKKGVKNLHVVVGSDRVDRFKQYLDQYNNVPSNHGYYNFDNIHVHSAGGRDPDAEGIEGVSGTSQRGHARAGDFEQFRAGAPSRMSDEHAAALMHDIRNAQPPAPVEKPKKKKLKEETIAGQVGGLGYNTGNPAVPANFVSQNTVDSDQKNNSLFSHHKDQSGKFNLVKFSSFDRKAAKSKNKGKI